MKRLSLYLLIIFLVSSCGEGGKQQADVSSGAVSVNTQTVDISTSGTKLKKTKSLRIKEENKRRE